MHKAPYPLAGEVRDIVSDIARMGGMSIAAHPSSAKPGLRFSEWTSPFDGLEWLNGDSESRDEPWDRLARVLFTYPFRPSESLATMLDRPDVVLRRWDALTARRRVVALPGADAHARVDLTGSDRAAGGLWLGVPGYAAMMGTFSVTAPGLRFSKDAEKDAGALLESLRSGHVYSTVDAIATPAAVSFRAVRAGTSWRAGDLIPPGDGDIELQVEHGGPPGSRIVLIKDGATEAAEQGSALRRSVPATRAVYRVEIHVPSAPGDPPVPWVVTNPLYIRAQDEAAAPRAEAAQQVVRYEGGAADEWRTETSSRSKAALDVVRSESGTQLLMRWAIGGTAAESPYAAFVMPAGPALSGSDRVMFIGRADRPMRLSVQFRTADGDRWRRSVYLDDQQRPVTVFFDDVRAVGGTSRPRLDPGAVRDVLFVVDTANMKPGAAGQVWIDDVRYGR